MKFFTTVNVSDVKVRGTATRGEKIDIESYTFEGNKKLQLNQLSLHFYGKKKKNDMNICFYLFTILRHEL